MVLLRKYNIYNDITKFRIGDIVKISFPGENFWTTITIISKTTKKISETIDNKLIRPYPNKTIKFKVENILDIYKKSNKLRERVKS